MRTALRRTLEQPADGAEEDVLLRAADPVTVFPVTAACADATAPCCTPSALGRCLTRLTDVTSGQGSMPHSSRR